MKGHYNSSTSVNQIKRQVYERFGDAEQSTKFSFNCWQKVFLEIAWSFLRDEGVFTVHSCLHAKLSEVHSINVTFVISTPFKRGNDTWRGIWGLINVVLIV